jgi:hypothetical protein
MMATFFFCDPWDSYMRYLEWESEQRYKEWERELDAIEDEDLHINEPGMFEARAGVDPFWPVAEVDPYEEIQVEMVPMELVA